MPYGKKQVLSVNQIRAKLRIAEEKRLILMFVAIFN